VLVVMLLAMTLLVGLVFFVYNLGDQVNHRLDLQNTADSVAISSSGWMARSLNTVAMGNVGQAKLISLALVLDAVPLAAELAVKELQEAQVSGDSLGLGLANQLARGVPGSRQEHGYKCSASFAKVVADAILLMPASEPVFSTLWPGDQDPQQGQFDYDAVHARIHQVGTILNSPKLAGRWRESQAVNEYGGDSFETLDPQASAAWAARPASANGQFHVYAWWSSETDGTHRYSATRYTITSDAGSQVVTADQNRNSGTWVYLGTFRFAVSQGTADVRISVEGPPDDHNRNQEFTNFLRAGLEKLAREIAPATAEDPSQLDELIALDSALNSCDELLPETGAYDVTAVTHWEHDGRRGQCWEAALAMRDLSRSAVGSAGPLAQANAQQFGQANRARTAFVAPLRPAIAYKQGSFEDFAPVLTGLFRVRLKPPYAATLDLPIYEEVDRINKLDESLDDVAAMLSAIQQNIDDIQIVREAVLGQPDWQQIDAQMVEMRRRVEDIQARRQAIAQRLGETGRLAGMEQRIMEILTLIDRIRDEIAHDKSCDRLGRYLDQLEQLHEYDEGSALGQAALDEEQLERKEKEGRLANLHNTCPGGGIPDYVSSPYYRLGPYATLFGWRHNWRRRTEQGNVGWSGDPEVGASWTGPTELLGYTTFGPYHWSLRQVTAQFGMAGSQTGVLDVSRFAYYVHLGANIKLAYAYGVLRPQAIRYVTRWISDYDEAKQYAADPDRQRTILRTRYYRPIAMSSVKWDHDSWLKDPRTYYGHLGLGISFGSDAQIDPPAALWIWEPYGWWDVAERRPQADRLNDFVWRWNRSYQAIFEERVNFPERRSAENGQPIPYDLFLTSWYVFGGIQIVEEVAVSNPCNWPAGETDIPAPLLLNTDAPPAGPGDYTVNHDQGARRTDFTYLGVASRSGQAGVWPQRFKTGNPSGLTVAVSQAEVFNNTSWDLWTQDWQAQLVPVTGWEDWTTSMIADLGSWPEESDIDEERVREIVSYLQRINPDLVEVFLNH